MSSEHHTAAWIAAIAGTLIGIALIAFGVYFYRKRVPGETSQKIMTSKVTGSVMAGVGLFILIVGWIWFAVVMRHHA